MATNGHSNDKASSSEEHRKLPDEKTLAEAGELMIKDENGNQVAFKSLYTGKPAEERQLIIFIRHFFCGVSCYQRKFLALAHMS